VLVVEAVVVTLLEPLEQVDQAVVGMAALQLMERLVVLILAVAEVEVEMLAVHHTKLADQAALA
jgi:hypothetical protein